MLEALTDAGFDNVVPIRFLEAVETLAQAIAPVIGYEQTAVCILDHDWATVVMVDTHGGETQDGDEARARRLRRAVSLADRHVRRNGWQPGGVVVVGADGDIDGLSWQLEKTLPVPVFVQSMAQVTIARGAALSAARSTEFTDEQLVEHLSEPVPAPAQKRQLSYAGALTALAAGASPSSARCHLRWGSTLAPASTSAAPKHATHSPPPQIAEAVTAVAPLPAAPQTNPPGPQATPPAGEPVPEPSAPEAATGRCMADDSRTAVADSPT